MITIIYVMMIYAKETAICGIKVDGVPQFLCYTFDKLPQIYRDYMKLDNISVEYNYEDDDLQGFDIFFIEKEED